MTNATSPATSTTAITDRVDDALVYPPQYSFSHPCGIFSPMWYLLTHVVSSHPCGIFYPCGIFSPMWYLLPMWYLGDDLHGTHLSDTSKCMTRYPDISLKMPGGHNRSPTGIGWHKTAKNSKNLPALRSANCLNLNKAVLWCADCGKYFVTAGKLLSSSRCQLSSSLVSLAPCWLSLLWCWCGVGVRSLRYCLC